MSNVTEVHDFKFRYVRNGEPAGWVSKKGRIEPNALFLGDDSISYDSIAETITRGDRILLKLRDGHLPEKVGKYLMEGPVLVLNASKPSARRVEMAIDRKCAQEEVRRRRQELAQNGQANLLRTEECPVCQATVDLSGWDPTPYIYCRFCESLFTQDRNRITDGEHYRLCDTCGMFDRVQQYTEFYFYFFLVVYGFRYRQRSLCDGCAHRLFVRALLLNLLFVVGVPSAIWVKIKSLRKRDPAFARLAKANALSMSRRTMEAGVEYEAVLRQQPAHPGVLMDRAIAALHAGDQKQAKWLIQKSLAACNHYLPVLQMLRA